jgi:ubiquinone/menaquinone biosynthesis C-methylase UbiE
MEQPDNSTWQDADHVRQYVERQKKSSPIEAELFAVMARLLRAIDPLTRVLDLGCGAGRFGRSIMDVCDGVELVFSDFSAEMLKAAREAVGERPLAHFVKADLTDAGWREAFSGKAFDAVVSGFSLHHLEEARRQAVFGEMQSLLRPGGMLLIAEWVASPSPWLEKIHNRWFIETSWHGGVFEGEDATFEQTLDRFANREDIRQGLLLPIGLQLDWLREAGYDDVSCYFKIFDMAIFGGRKPA